jgi:hypothetical protein
VGERRRRAWVRRDCRIRTALPAPRRRRALVRVAFAGNRLLAPAAARRRG